MNEKLSNALAELIQTTLSGVDATKDFFVSELPDVIQQLLMWHGAYSLILFILPLVIFPFVIFFALKIPKNLGEPNGYGDSIPTAKGWVYVGLEALTGILFIASLLSINLQWLQIWIAPKVWLIEYAGKLIK